MKKIFLGLILISLTTLSIYAQNGDAAILENGINTKMISWSSEWWVDSYNNNSANIIDIDKSNSSEWYLTGTFWVTRVGQRLKMNFTSTVKIYSGGSWKITKLCYDDPSVGRAVAF